MSIQDFLCPMGKCSLDLPRTSGKSMMALTRLKHLVKQNSLIPTVLKLSDPLKASQTTLKLISITDFYLFIVTLVNLSKILVRICSMVKGSPESLPFCLNSGAYSQVTVHV